MLNQLNFLFFLFYRKSARNAIAQVVATVAKHDLPKNQWPQLFQFLTSYTKSVNPGEREVNEVIQLLMGHS